MKDERFTRAPAVVNHFTEEYDVIAPAEFANHSADEVSRGAFQERAAFDVVAAVDCCEPIRELRRKSVRKMVLICCKDVNGKMARLGEISKLG